MASLYEHIRAQRMPSGSTTPLVLPDEPEEGDSYGLPRIRWAAGARDGVAVFHVPGRKPGVRQVAPIVDALLAYVKSPVPREREALESVVVRVIGDDAFVPFVGPVLDRLEGALDAEHSLAEVSMSSATRRLLLETERRDVLKLAIALLGAFGAPEDRELLETVGLHDEFTLYAIDALASIVPDPIDSWMLFAISLTGWGKIHAVLALVERLPESGPRRDEVIRYLLRYGCENGVQNGYLALPIAVAARLADALANPAPDRDLLLGAGVILSSLAEDAAQGGPSGDMGEYPEGAVAAERYVGAVPGSAAGERLDSFLAVASLRSFLQEVVPHDLLRWQELGWSRDACARILERADAWLSLPRWREQALKSLQTGDPVERWKGRAICRVLEVPIATELEFVVGADPSDVGAWHDLSQQADREGMERAASIAPSLLRLDKLFVGGPTTSLGFGPDFPRFEICDAIADGLARFPGSGGGFLIRLLESPSVRNRHSALRAYESWPQLGPDDRAAIAVVAAGDPDGRVREHAEKLKLEKG
jgi:hypothetical protein